MLTKKFNQLADFTTIYKMYW